MKLSLSDGRLNCRSPPKMKPTDSIEKNDPLGRTLQEWKVDASLPPQFRDAVWRRIELTETRREPYRWCGFWQAFGAAFGRPALVISYVAILLLAGLSIGFARARQESARLDEALGARYVQSIDPYQAPRH